MRAWYLIFLLRTLLLWLVEIISPIFGSLGTAFVRNIVVSHIQTPLLLSLAVGTIFFFIVVVIVVDSHRDRAVVVECDTIRAVVP